MEYKVSYFDKNMFLEIVSPSKCCELTVGKVITLRWIHPPYVDSANLCYIKGDELFPIKYSYNPDAPGSAMLRVEKEHIDPATGNINYVVVPETKEEK